MKIINGELIVDAPSSIKEQVKNYIVLKIFYEKWKIWDTIPSENRMAITFECSRLTVRSAINELVHIGMLSPVKGKGYQVMEKPQHMIYNDLTSTYSNEDIETKELNEKITEIFEKVFGISYFTKLSNVEKNKYMYSKNNDPKMIVYKINNLNAESQVPITTKTKHVYSNDEMFRKDFEILGLPENSIITCELNYDFNHWINMQVRIQTPDIFEESNTKFYLN